MTLETNPREELIGIVLKYSDAREIKLRNRIIPENGCSIILMGATKDQAQAVANQIDVSLDITEALGGWFIYTDIRRHPCPPLLMELAKDLPGFDFSKSCVVSIEIRD